MVNVKLLKLACAASLEEQARVLNRSGSPNFRLMYDIMHYMVSYPDAVDHPREDLIFDKLKRMFLLLVYGRLITICLC